MKTGNHPTAPLSSFSSFDGELEVVSVHDHDGSVKRLCELGLCPGKRVSVVRKGDPAILRIGTSRFALSSELLANVLVRPAA
jgi:Fe2+ transport system protein FeoA